MCQVVDGLVEKLGATVVLIPHDTDPMLDDRVVARRIAENVKHSAKVKVIDGMYTAPELKAIIGLCDLFVGGKMHANIAALTMCVPTVALQYGHKFHGIMSLLGQDEYVCDQLTVHEVMSKAEHAWSNRASVSAELTTKATILKKRSLENAVLAADLLSSRR
jgi:polysaccharide pyruvyl transferase WcaK-like protein